MKNKLLNLGRATILLLTIAACSKSQSLQEYFVEHANNPDFISVDVPASILHLDEQDLSPDQEKALRSVKKLNVLTFAKNDGNQAQFAEEVRRVNAILADDRFTELMKLNTVYGKGVVTFLGNDEAIDEVVIFGSSADKGFALIRVLGDNMNPAYLAELIQAIQKSDFKGEGLGKLGALLKG